MNLKHLAIALVLSLSHPSFAAESESKYAEFSELGNPADVLEVKVAEPKELEEGEVKVDVLASPIHPSNLLQIAGLYGVAPKLPSTPGSEGVGRVMEVSDDVTHLSKGQLVLLLGGGAWRDEIVAPASEFIPLARLDDASLEVIEQLSMSAINPMTAMLMLTKFAELKEGDWVVQSAANSAVGGYLIQLAKQRGIKTANVVRRNGLEKELKAKGADLVLIDGPDLVEKLASATDNGRIALALDAVGGETFTRLAESLSNGGTLVTYGLLSGKNASLNPRLNIFNDIKIQGFWLSKWYQTASSEEKQAALGELIPMIASGALRADIDSRFSVAEIKQAVTRAAQRGRSGKVLVIPE